AVSLRDDGSGRLPLASDATEVAGTPCYMAPEMLGGSVSRISEQTDVYLLGAALCEILTGQPPHRGATLSELVKSISAGRPTLPDDLSPELTELGAIVNRAMAPEPSQRFGSAAELCDAVKAFLQHRGSAALALEAG